MKNVWEMKGIKLIFQYTWNSLIAWPDWPWPYILQQIYATDQPASSCRSATAMMHKTAERQQSHIWLVLTNHNQISRSAQPSRFNLPVPEIDDNDAMPSPPWSSATCICYMVTVWGRSIDSRMAVGGYISNADEQMQALSASISVSRY